MISDERDRQIEARNERIRQLRAQGLKRVTIARLVGTSNSTVGHALDGWVDPRAVGARGAQA
jgi:hypothetical protein